MNQIPTTTKLLFLAIIAFIIFTDLSHASSAKPAKNDVYCLTEAIYFEARGSSYADQAAVADVILNRVDSKHYPDTICEVVHQYKQFSYYWDGKSDRMLDRDAKASANLLAVQMLVHGTYRGLTENSLLYHANYVNPYWAKHYRFVGTIGAHKFYTTTKD
jgi:spore germination cell wall hydrolase CwlJ-like protein